MKTITSKIIKHLKLPRPNSHKGDNGRLLIIAGSKQYHGALIYAIKTASRIVDLVYVVTTAGNKKLLEKMKLKTAEFVPVILLPKNKGRKGINFDCVLIGPGMGTSDQTKKLVAQVLISNKKAVLDADALNVLNNKLKKLLNYRCILTPHHREFKKLFGISANASNAQKMAKKHKCTIVLKGPLDYIAGSDGSLWQNKTGNQGMTKGGTGDVLAGLIAGLYCTNDASTTAAAGTFICGEAGDDLYKKVGTFYNAEDLCEQIPKTFKNILDKI